MLGLVSEQIALLRMDGTESRVAEKSPPFEGGLEQFPPFEGGPGGM